MLFMYRLMFWVIVEHAIIALGYLLLWPLAPWVIKQWPPPKKPRLAWRLAHAVVRASVWCSNHRPKPTDPRYVTCSDCEGVGKANE
jgi:hypothetical protein